MTRPARTATATWLRRVLAGVVAFLVLAGVGLVLADGALRAAAERAISQRLQDSAGLAEPPTVTIQGSAFILQMLRGRYERAQVAALTMPAGTVTLTGVDARLSGVRLPLRALLRGRVRDIPVREMRVEAVLPYPELARAVGDRRLSFSAAPDSDLLRITGRVDVLGQEVSASADSAVTLAGPEVVLTSQRVDIGNGLANGALSRAVRGRFDARVPAPQLPYGLGLSSVLVGPQGLVVAATGTDVVLPAG